MTCKRMTHAIEVEGRTWWWSWLLCGPAGIAELMMARAKSAPADLVIDGEGWRGVSLGLHTPVPQYEGQAQDSRCELMDGLPCYFEFSSTAASRLLRERAETGDDETVWTALECEYAEAERLAVNPVGR